MNLPKRTKIVATLGPATQSREILKEMILAGVNVCRINFSHGEHKDLEKIVQTIRDIDHELGTHTGILGDLQGPKIRIGNLVSEPLVLAPKHRIIFSTKPLMGDAKKVHINYAQFPQDVSPGEKILVDDGKLLFEVIQTNGVDEVELECVFGGNLNSRKGVNLPDTKISMPSLTPKDLEDLQFALQHRFHWVGLSFVRRAQDIDELREIIAAAKMDTRIVAKIEKPEALRNLDDIIEVADAQLVFEKPIAQLVHPRFRDRYFVNVSVTENGIKGWATTRATTGLKVGIEYKARSPLVSIALFDNRYDGYLGEVALWFPDNIGFELQFRPKCFILGGGTFIQGLKVEVGYR